MTREEFDYECTSFEELYDFCRGHGFCAMDGVYTDGDYESQILQEARDFESMDSLTDWLSDLPPCREFYYFEKNEYGDWYGIDKHDDGTFDEWYDKVVQEANEVGFFDEDEEEDPYDEELYRELPQVPPEELHTEELEHLTDTIFAICDSVELPPPPAPHITATELYEARAKKAEEQEEVQEETVTCDFSALLA